MDERIEAEILNLSSISNQSETTTQKLWHYGKQVLKGAALFGVGILGYVGIRRFAARTNKASEEVDKFKHPDSVISLDAAQYIKSEPQMRYSNQVPDKDLKHSSSINQAELPETRFQRTNAKRVTSNLKRKVGDKFQVNINPDYNSGHSSILNLCDDGEFMVVWDCKPPIFKTV